MQILTNTTCHSAADHPCHLQEPMAMMNQNAGAAKEAKHTATHIPNNSQTGKHCHVLSVALLLGTKQSSYLDFIKTLLSVI